MNNPCLHLMQTEQSVKILPLIIALFLVLTPTSAESAIITTASGTNGADSYIQSDDPNVAKGTTDPTRVRARSSGSIRHAYLRFDLTSLGFSGSQIGPSTLTLFSNQDNDVLPNTVQLYGIDDGATGDALLDWAEATLTWNNAPQNSAGNTVGPDVTLLAELEIVANPIGDPARFSFPAGQAFEFSSSALSNFLRSDTNGLASFILVQEQPTSSSLTVASKENVSQQAPTLEVANVPEPTSLAYVGGCLCVGLIRCFRRGGFRKRQ